MVKAAWTSWGIGGPLLTKLDVRALAFVRLAFASGSAPGATNVLTSFKFEFCSSMVDSLVFCGALAGPCMVVAALFAFFDIAVT